LRDAGACIREFAIRNRASAIEQRRRRIVDALREQRGQCVGNQNEKSSVSSAIRKKFSAAQKKFRRRLYSRIDADIIPARQAGERECDPL
jgi:hypothetical protein